MPRHPAPPHRRTSRQRRPALARAFARRAARWLLLLLLLPGLPLLAGGLVSSQAAALPLLINNGLAPPNPENVIAVPLQNPDNPVLTVRNAGCTDFTAPCPSPGAATTVEIAPGAVMTGFIDVRDTSRLEVTGGSFNTGGVFLHDSAELSISDASSSRLYPLVANDTSRITIASGSLGSLLLDDSANGLVTGGTYSEGVFVRGSSTLVYSGSAADRVTASGTSSLLMTGGATNVLGVGGSASILMTGGAVSDGIGADGQGRLRIEGLSRSGCPSPCGLELAGIRARDSSIVTIVGTSFAVDGVPIGFGLLSAQTGLLSGTFLAGNTFFMRDPFFHNGYTSSGGQTYTGQIWLVPEPGTGWLVAGGLLVLGARRRSLQRRQSPRRTTTLH
jgi:hypothetical protein